MGQLISHYKQRKKHKHNDDEVLSFDDSDDFVRESLSISRNDSEQLMSIIKKKKNEKQQQQQKHHSRKPQAKASSSPDYSPFDMSYDASEYMDPETYYAKIAQHKLTGLQREDSSSPSSSPSSRKKKASYSADEHNVTKQQYKASHRFTALFSSDKTHFGGGGYMYF
ncbi:hypothetical protein FDP41_013757 [Naegleria fowleri]|uniref:Uncharacterized protein n=1 Tax=Naegleria fowleri TaxID=5763 RepID=A0A6A5BR65_NAEFO|nr:uncharacterized protein FDP41_013757 [Naegleria fowleri]KAF0980543.1 hypothetical protein FDP41_013757 [Naegleria fowleri]CAG4711894.1 unnamed protein product [Naegleria fowleri]